jgi:hypothetical protein
MEKQQKQPILRTIAILGLGVIPLAACAQNAGSSSLNLSVPTFDGTSYYDSVAERVGLDSANANNIDEQFTGGKMSDTVWNALSGVWQNDSAAYPHNGMQAHNLFYVKNGSKTQLAFKGRGIYSSDSDTVIKNGYREPEGACIISKNHLGPGRYEIAMAAMPREGGVSAMWTYCTTTGSEATSQNEIDIEIGGNTSETYMREWCTTWTKHTSKATINVDVSKLCYLNDGAIHKYTFDWYTDYRGTGERRVDWFVDGVFIATVTGEEVSETEMPLWIGLWFPNWSSAAAFDTDYLLVDSIKYTAFDSTQTYENCRAKSGYTQTVPSQTGIQSIDYSVVHDVNKIANGDFASWEVCKQDSSNFGWKRDDASKGSDSLVNDASKGQVLQMVAGTGSESIHGEYLTQTISNAYAGYTYSYSIDAKKASEATSAQIELHYSTINGSTLEGTKTIALESSDWKNYCGTITLPEKCGNLRLDLVVNDGTALFDNASVKFVSAH